jgi:hypothetical protein
MNSTHSPRDDVWNNPIDSSYHVIEGVLTEAECELYKKIVLDNLEGVHDKFPYFDWMNIPSDSLLEGPAESTDSEKEMFGRTLHGIMKIGYEFFIKTYQMTGKKFGFNRLHGNVMREGASFVVHADEHPDESGSYDNNKKTFVGALFLNDDYEGGEYVFPQQDSVFKPKLGSLVLFPGYCTPHGINEITSGTRVNVLIIYFDVPLDKHLDEINYP